MGPKDMIQELQAEHGIDVPLAAPVLHLTDTLAVPRAMVLAPLADKLAETLLARVNAAPIENLRGLLAESFRYTAHPVLGAVPVAIMARLPSLPQSFIKLLAASPPLLAASPLHVRQQTWAAYPSLFRDHLSALLAPYLAPFEAMTAAAPQPAPANKVCGIRLRLPAGTSLSPWTSPRAETVARLGPLADTSRRHEVGPAAAGTAIPSCAVLGELAWTLGSILPLYNVVLEEARSRFVGAASLGVLAAYASLRADVLVALTASGNPTIVRADPLSPFVDLFHGRFAHAASFDELVGDAPLLASLLELYARIPEASPLLGDLGMVLAQPAVYEWLVHAALRKVHAVMEAQALPRDSTELTALTQLAMLAVQARVMMLRRQFTFDASLDLASPDDHLRGFFPALISLLLDFSMESVPPSLDDIDPMLLGFAARSPFALHLLIALLGEGLASGTLSGSSAIFLAGVIGYGIDAAVAIRARAQAALAKVRADPATRHAPADDGENEFDDMDEDELSLALCEQVDPDSLAPCILRLAARVGEVAARSALRGYAVRILKALADANVTELSDHAKAVYSGILDALSLAAPADATTVGGLLAALQPRLA
ncbi:uncharacterized protein AMSG_08459 [Thecamonas trahens ATCC 50062]|uniref:Uncharacterized protein n=1 Tax=Thecamonas trahens ATCC 50062 TaxID=461836 RepID=A0A0L0DKN7_THETB|nr:hypothetical protein AMSG_08459 [Thecamonas trahens ATCC 50062]KNC52596.1 hypothetical protein AMSG_08459 [Thecamonas trahens ATCC 50062]|eukprot:XP_013755155.1 hypothetical protein AMSG_08459 [Thecamonas trahens ATCC 50062]